jgi:hypothetical protein
MPRLRKSVDNTALLEAALEGLELQKTRIDAQLQEVRRLLGRRGPRAARTEAPAAPAAAPKRRALSAAARKRIAAAQKRRWAEYRKASKAPAKAVAKKEA